MQQAYFWLVELRHYWHYRHWLDFFFFLLFGQNTNGCSKAQRRTSTITLLTDKSVKRPSELVHQYTKVNCGCSTASFKSPKRIRNIFVSTENLQISSKKKSKTSYHRCSRPELGSTCTKYFRKKKKKRNDCECHCNVITML